MRKHNHWLLLVIIIGICCSPASGIFAQSDYSDSLRQQIAKLPEGHEKALSLLNLSKVYVRVDNDSALYYSASARKIAERNDFTDILIGTGLVTGRVHNINARYKEALVSYQDVAELAESITDSSKVASARYNMGLNLNELAEFDEAIQNHQSSLRLYLALNDSLGIMANYNAIGLSYSRMANYDSAAYYLNKAIVTGEKAGFEANLMPICNNLGEVLFKIDQYDDARKYVKRALELSEKYKNISNEALSYNILGRIDDEEGDYASAFENYNKSAVLYRETGDSLQLYHIYNNLGVAYRNQGDLKTAGVYFYRALEGYRKLEFNRGIIIVQKNRAVLMSMLGKHETADDLLDTVINLAKQYGYSDHHMGALWNKFENYEKSGNYRKAFEYQRAYYNLQDSLYTVEKEERINDLILKYEKEKDQALILALENENLAKDLTLKQQRIQRDTFLYTGITLVALAVFLFLYIHQRRIKDKIIAEQRIHRLEEEKKLIAAKLLVEGQEEERKRIATELHDGLGVLLSATKMQFSTIMDKSPENRVIIEKASRLLDQASGDVRKISHNMMPGLLTKMGFFEAVEDLLDHIGEAEGLNVVFDLQRDPVRLAENKEIMLYRIIQEMVNNTLKHARAENIKLQLKGLPDSMIIIYADDGTGFDFKQKLESGTLGLKSIQSRVDFLNGSMDVDSSAGEGVKYTLQIPF